MWWFAVLVLALALGCGDEGPVVAQELFGTWQEVSTEVGGESWDCLTDCATMTFNADGTYVIVMITPPAWGEGTWSTQGDMLTLTRLRAGPDADSLEPFDPPRITTFRWSVSGDTLAMSIPGSTFYWQRIHARGCGAYRMTARMAGDPIHKPSLPKPTHPLRPHDPKRYSCAGVSWDSSVKPGFAAGTADAAT